MVKGDFYERKSKATQLIMEKFQDYLNNNNPINFKNYYLKVSLSYGFGQKFVDEILFNLIELYGLIKEGNNYIKK